MSTPRETTTSVDDLKAHASEAVRKVSDQLNEQANLLSDSVSTARYNTQEFIENNPWQSVAIAVGIGFLLGVVVARR